MSGYEKADHRIARPVLCPTFCRCHLRRIRCSPLGWNSLGFCCIAISNHSPNLWLLLPPLKLVIFIVFFIVGVFFLTFRFILFLILFLLLFVFGWRLLLLPPIDSDWLSLCFNSSYTLFSVCWYRGNDSAVFVDFDASWKVREEVNLLHLLRHGAAEYSRSFLARRNKHRTVPRVLPLLQFC